MENKNTKELRGYKAGLKSKLMGAVAMLLVSAIMVSSATYAWFVLSTHPEVKGMSTTVGSNGALEIALLNNTTGKDLSTVKAEVGDSTKGVTVSNETWGNIVDLSNASYGLEKITLYPAALNATGTGAAVTFASHSALLKYAKYGTDGRITELAADTAAGKRNAEGTGFFADTTDNPDYGVRAIGTTTKASAGALALETAKSNYSAAVAAAGNSVKTALGTHQATLSAIATTHANETKAAPATYTANDVAAINASLDAVKSAAEKLQEALKWASAARELSENGGVTVPSLESITLNTEYQEMFDALGGIATDASTNKITAENTSYGWDEIQTAYQHLMNTNSMIFQPNGRTSTYTVDTLKEITIEEGAAMINAGAKITLKAGAFVSITDYVGSFETGKFDLQFTYKGQTATAKNSNYVVETRENPVKMAAITTVVATLTAKDGGSAQAAITNVYGYIVDLAFQTNIAGDLQLQSAGVNRVSSDISTATQGGGTLFTVEGDVDAAALAAMRVVFIGSDNKILAVGKFDAAPTAEGGKAYALHLYEYTFENGALKVDTNKKDADTVTKLEANTPVAVSALVYLDGDSTSYAQGGIKGTLNLQFKHSAGDLAPMVYDFSAATGGATGNEEP